MVLECVEIDPKKFAAVKRVAGIKLFTNSKSDRSQIRGCQITILLLYLAFEGCFVDFDNNNIIDCRYGVAEDET